MRRHVEWCGELMRIQHDQHMYFLFEHPEAAKSWTLNSIRRLATNEDVITVVGKGMRWMTNSSEVARMIEKMLKLGEDTKSIERQTKASLYLAESMQETPGTLYDLAARARPPHPGH